MGIVKKGLMFEFEVENVSDESKGFYILSDKELDTDKESGKDFFRVKNREEADICLNELVRERNIGDFLEYGIPVEFESLEGKRRKSQKFRWAYNIKLDNSKLEPPAE